MKSKFIVLIGVVVLAIIVLLWSSRNGRILPSPRAQRESGQHAQTLVQSHQFSLTKPSPTISNATPQVNTNSKPATIQEWMERQYSMSISFYGRVVDESNSPVSGASIGFDWADANGEGHNTSMISDSNGFFSITGIKGKGIDVEVNKIGYYGRRNSFNYADDRGRRTFSPDPMNPVVFSLRKKGPGVDLITSQYGVKNYVGVSMPLDGTPVRVDLLNHAVGQNGQLITSQIKPQYKNWQRATNWFFKMEIPDGGFVVENDEFPFNAPHSGYQPVVTFNFEHGQADWTINLQTNFYIKFGNPPKYGRLHLETSIMMNGARLTYAINPDGSRYLEPKQ